MEDAEEENQRAENSNMNEKKGAWVPGKAALSPTHLPLVEELLQLLISCAEVLVRGSWPLFVQDIGRRQVVLQPQ